MADAGYYDGAPPPEMEPEMGSPASRQQQMHTSPSKFSCHFLCRGLFVAIFIALLPLFPAQAPEFFDQTILTRNWELLHLLIVGIAVSYGLFSRWNNESFKESQMKTDTTLAYVSKILDVSTVFDDENESPSGLDDKKVHTWNSRYLRGRPRVVVAKGGTAPGDCGKISLSVGSGKPLSLPIRSLKSRVSGPEDGDRENGAEGIEVSGDDSESDLEVSCNIHQQRNGSGGIGEFRDGEVLPSPIPWRSRSGRMESNRETVPATARSHSFPSSDAPNECDPFQSPSTRSSSIHRSPRPNSSPSPLRSMLSPAPSLSPEMRGKSGEDSGKKNAVHKSPPSPPPPIPPPISSKSAPQAANSIPTEGVLSRNAKNHTGGTLTNEVKNSNRSRSRRSREDFPMVDGMDTDVLRSETRPNSRPEEPPTGRSFRTRRGELEGEWRKGRDSDGDGVQSNAKNYTGGTFANEVKNSNKSRSRSRSSREDFPIIDGMDTDVLIRSEKKPSSRPEETPNGKSVRTQRRSEHEIEWRKGRDTNENGAEPKIVMRSKEVPAATSFRAGVEETFAKSGSNQTTAVIEKHPRSAQISPSSSRKQEYGKKVLDVPVDSEGDRIGESSDWEVSAAAAASVAGTNCDSNEVDKKADEFIAKFREQIRLQRIESIKRSAGQKSR